MNRTRKVLLILLIGLLLQGIAYDWRLIRCSPEYDEIVSQLNRDAEKVAIGKEGIDVEPATAFKNNSRIHVTHLFKHPYALEDVRQYYRKSLKESQWEIEISSIDKNLDENRETYRKNNQVLNVVYSTRLPESETTYVVINLTYNDPECKANFL